MKEYILGEENNDEENGINSNLIGGKKLDTKIKNKFNYKFWIINNT